MVVFVFSFGFFCISLRRCLSWTKLEMGHGHKILTRGNTLKATKFEEVLGFLRDGSIEEEAVG